MSTTKLSWRAEEILGIVHERTERDDEGKLLRFYVPTAGFVHTIYGEPVKGGATIVGGSGDAKILRSMEEKGLLVRQKLGDYSYATTEDGAVEYEKIAARRRAQ